jgi:hypothetical protein
LRTIVDPPGEPQFRGGVVWLHRTPTVSKTVNLLAFPSRAAPGPGLDVADVRQPAAAANSLDFDYHDQLLDLRLAGCPCRERRHAPRPSQEVARPLGLSEGTEHCSNARFDTPPADRPVCTDGGGEGINRS